MDAKRLASGSGHTVANILLTNWAPLSPGCCSSEDDTLCS